MESNILLAMPMFKDGHRYQLQKVIDDLRQRWGIEILEVNGDEDAAVIGIAGQTAAIAFIEAPVPWSDIEGTAKYAYNWPRSTKDLADHNGHAIVSIMDGEGSPLQWFTLLSKILYSVLVTSNAIGVYQGGQSLLISRSQYLQVMDKLAQDDIPVSLWIYIGLKEYIKANCAYTYGLTAFNKKEMEIINSELTLEELYNLLSNMSSYVIISDVILNDGETIGYTAEHKIGIKCSDGEFVKGQSLKLLA